MGYILAAVRAIILIITLGIYVLIFLIGGLFTRQKEKIMVSFKKSWCNLAMKVLGMRVHLIGKENLKQSIQSPTPYLAVCNHRSFIDPVVILGFLNVRPLSMADVSAYPLIGYAARKIGVIFVARDSKGSRKNALTSIIHDLGAGNNVLVFPEGSTSDHHTTLDFKVGAFYGASKKGVPVLPLTLHYAEKDAIWLHDNLIKQFFRHFRHAKTRVYFKIGELKQLSTVAEDILHIRAEINQNIEALRLL